MPKKDKYSTVSTTRKILVTFGLLIFLFGGMFAAIVAVDKYKNYVHPYIFTFLFGFIGLAIGLYVAKKIKPYVLLNKTMLSNYYSLTIQFSVGFIGTTLLFGHLINSGISKHRSCDDYTVIDTEHIEGGYRRPEYNIVYVAIDGHTEPILCRRNYWQTLSSGQKVNICIFDSPIGFDNLVLTSDQ